MWINYFVSLKKVCSKLQKFSTYICTVSDSPKSKYRRNHHRINFYLFSTRLQDTFSFTWWSKRWYVTRCLEYDFINGVVFFWHNICVFSVLRIRNIIPIFWIQKYCRAPKRSAHMPYGGGGFYLKSKYGFNCMSYCDMKEPMVCRHE